MRPLIAGNWKMHGLRADGLALARAIAAGAAGAELVVCPPATLLAAIAEAVAGSGIGIGGQDCHAASAGAHTGEVSAAMLRDAGATHVIVGHSERRAQGETDAKVRAKASAAIAAGLTPILCVGESEAERAAGEAEAVVLAQLAAAVPHGFAAAGGIVAYEPVWAIGSGRIPTGADIAAMHAGMRSVLPGTRLLYGGSVKPGNAAAILALAHVDGALVGGASLVAADFLAIAAAAA